MIDYTVTDLNRLLISKEDWGEWSRSTPRLNVLLVDYVHEGRLMKTALVRAKPAEVCGYWPEMCRKANLEMGYMETALGTDRHLNWDTRHQCWLPHWGRIKFERFEGLLPCHGMIDVDEDQEGVILVHGRARIERMTADQSRAFLRRVAIVKKENCERRERTRNAEYQWVCDTLMALA